MAVPVAAIAKTAVKVLGLFKKGEGEDSSLGGKLVIIILLIAIASILLIAVVVTMTLSTPISIILNMFGLNILDNGQLDTPIVSPSQYVYPTELTNISNSFGSETEFYPFHTGIDIPVAEGSSLVAIEGGKIVDYGYDEDFGRWLLIEHTRQKPSLTWVSDKEYLISYYPMTFYTFYAHLLQVKCVINQGVKKGDIIAVSGGNINNEYDYWTGNSTGSHLHFEVRENNPNIRYVVDPLTYLNRNIVEDEINELLKSVDDSCIRVG